MSNQKLVSVCINAYNSENTIKETLESVLNQTYKNLQVIVVDDCSTDRTAEIVENTAASDGRVELYRLPENGNISNANNEAILHARGEYIAHLDSDDVWMSDKLEKQVAFLEENPEYGACFSHVKSVDENGEELGEDAYFDKLFNIENRTQAELIRFFFNHANHLCHSTMLIRKSVQDEIGLHDLSLLYLHDYDMWIRLLFRYPIYIYQEPLIRYRVRHDSNSQPTDEKMVANNEELSRVVYNLVDNCPDELFLEAFSDSLRYKGEHTHDDVELEKAFVLMDGFISLEGNCVLGIRKFDSLFSRKEIIKAAKEHFNFSLRDYYDLHKKNIFYDYRLKRDYDETKKNYDETKRVYDETRQALDDTKKVYDETRQALDDTKKVYDETRQALDDTALRLTETEAENVELVNSRDLGELRIEELDRRIGGLESTNHSLNDINAILMKSPSMRLTKPLRNISSFFNVRNYIATRRFINGRKSAVKVVLFGFYGHNLGDDMFFDMLFRRYPDTMFCVEHTPDYAWLMSKYDNVRFFDVSAKHFRSFDRLGSFLGIDSWSKELLYSTSDAAVHIGGSIYQQIADWEIDIKQRKQRNSMFDNFFAISNNFGPYSTKEYKDFWANEFNGYTDICFRDIYSYSLFSELRNVRYAPDLLFGFKDEAQVNEEKRVAISVINPRFRVRSFSEEQSAGYERKIKELINYYASNGYEISLLGFCSLEEDRQEVEKIWLELDRKTREKVRRVCYGNDYKEITDEIKRSQTVIATRFHAMILGYVLGKRVLPICYGDKVINVINDLNLTKDYVTLDSFAGLEAQKLDSMANRVDSNRVAHLRSLADEQFYGLDRFIESMGGKVVK